MVKISIRWCCVSASARPRATAASKGARVPGCCAASSAPLSGAKIKKIGYRQNIFAKSDYFCNFAELLNNDTKRNEYL